KRGIHLFAFANEAGIDPLLGDAFELAEEIKLWLLTGIAKLRVEQSLGNVEQQRGRPHVPQVLQTKIDALADDAGISRDRRADDVGGEYQYRIIVEIRVETFFG